MKIDLSSFIKDKVELCPELDAPVGSMEGICFKLFPMSMVYEAVSSVAGVEQIITCLLYTSPSPRD